MFCKNITVGALRTALLGVMGFLVPACASDQYYWALPIDAAGAQDWESVSCIDNDAVNAFRRSQAAVERSDDNALNENEQLFAEMTITALIGEIAYCDAVQGEEEKKIRTAMRDYRALSYNAAYIRPQLSPLTTFPSVYLLSKPQSHRIIVYFPGLDAAASPADLLQSLKAGAAEDQPFPGRLYIPRGHEGFREGVLNLADDGFFLQAKSFEELAQECGPAAEGSESSNRKIVSLASFICAYDVIDPSRSDPIELVVGGHSLGAGVAQSALGAFSGLTWRQENTGSWTVAPPERNWPFRVSAAYLYSPPLALYPRDESCRPIAREDVNPKNVYAANGLIDRTYSIIKDGDPIPDLWRPGGPSINCVEGEHIGKKVAIPRGEDPDVAAKQPVAFDWHNPFPHRLQSYRRALENAVRQTQQKRPKSTDETAPAQRAEY